MSDGNIIDLFRNKNENSSPDEEENYIYDSMLSYLETSEAPAIVLSETSKGDLVLETNIEGEDKFIAMLEYAKMMIILKRALD